MLTPDIENLWTEYLLLESQCHRKATISALSRFVSSLLESKIPYDQWAFSLAERVVDENQQIPVRIPLFRKIIFPALLSGHRRKIKGCARWLAGFSQQLYHCPDLIAELADDEQTEIGLLFAAIKLNPSDETAGQRLVSAFATRLENALHELPDGVLYGMDGATPDQCQELVAELQQFTFLASRYSSGIKYESLIERCRFHFKHYAVYLTRINEFQPYAEYLETIGTSGQDAPA